MTAPSNTAPDRARERERLVAEARKQADYYRKDRDWGTADVLTRLAAALEAAAKDAERLDWLDRQRGDVTGEDQYGELELQGHGWGVYGQCLDVRTAIDAARAAEAPPHETTEGRTDG